MMLHWTSGTPVKIERTSVWKTWSTGYALKLWSLKVSCSRASFALSYETSSGESLIMKIPEHFFPYGSPSQVDSLRVS